LEPPEENEKANPSNTNGNGKKDVGCEMGRETDKRLADSLMRIKDDYSESDATVLF